MKSHESNKTINSIIAPPIKPTRFRFPFKKSSFSMQPASGLGGSPPMSHKSPTNSGLFNLGRKLGFKPTSPTLRKSVSFSSGRGSPVKDSNMDWRKKISADHTDVAYREAVGRLRAILSPRSSNKTFTDSSSPHKDKLDLSSPSKVPHPHTALFNPEKKEGRITSSLRHMFTKDANANNQLNLNNQANAPLAAPRTLPYPYGYQPTFYGSDPANLQREDDLFGFIEKQSEYITQLEKETKHSRGELATMLDKVKDVIAENEELHQKQKTDLLTNMIQHLDSYGTVPNATGEDKQPKSKPGEGKGSSNLILESKVAELEAQLSQARRSLRLAQEEILEIRKGNIAGTSHTSHTSYVSAIEGASGLNNNLYANCDLHRTEIDTLVREKSDLLDTMQKMKQMVGELRDRESDAAKKVKNSLEIVEQMQMEKTQSDMDTRRLKEELDRHQQRIRDMIQDHSRRLHEEKSQVEKKYKQELDQLNNEMNIELDSLTKAKLDLERQKRLEADLRRELQQKMQTIDDIRQEMQMKMSHMQAELANVLAQKSSVDQELINSRLNAEKADRDARHDAARFQAEINGLRKRLEQSDMELVKEQEMIAKLNETISQLQRENSLAKIRLESHIAENPELADADVVTIIQNMEQKHNRDMQDLEGLIQQQNGLLDKLRGECRTLTDKLEETSKQYKDDLMSGLQSCVTTLQSSLPLNKAETAENLQDSARLAELSENQLFVSEELSSLLDEMMDWMSQTVEESGEKDFDKEKDDSESEKPIEESDANDQEENQKDEKEEISEPPKDSDETIQNAEKEPTEDNKDSEVKEESKQENNPKEWKFKVLETNNKLMEWVQRIQTIIERFSNSSPNKVDC